MKQNYPTVVFMQIIKILISEADISTVQAEYGKNSMRIKYVNTLYSQRDGIWIKIIRKLRLKLIR